MHLLAKLDSELCGRNLCWLWSYRQIKRTRQQHNLRFLLPNTIDLQYVWVVYIRVLMMMMYGNQFLIRLSIPQKRLPLLKRNFLRTLLTSDFRISAISEVNLHHLYTSGVFERYQYCGKKSENKKCIHRNVKYFHGIHQVFDQNLFQMSERNCLPQPKIPFRHPFGVGPNFTIPFS